MNIFLKKHRILLVHVLFWCLYFSFFFYQISLGRGNRDSPNYFRAFLDALFQALSLAGISYFNYFVLLPRFLKHQKGIHYIIEIIATLFLIVPFQLYIKHEIYKSVFNSDHFDFFFRTSFIIQHTLNVVLVMGFVAMLRFATEWFDLQARKQEVENEKLASELRFLKEQINPHFLFNTLNNLYYLAHSQSPKTPDIIAKLSQMMRYMIYDSNQEKVPVVKEIEYIENYIELEKMRLEDDFIVSFSVEGNYQHLRIAPFILITFLENAFKHGVTGGESGNIAINLSFNDSQCYYEVKNAIAIKNNNNEEGIGLLNVKRRLNLIYPGKHLLTANKKDSVFIASLMLEL